MNKTMSMSKQQSNAGGMGKTNSMMMCKHISLAMTAKQSCRKAPESNLGTKSNEAPEDRYKKIITEARRAMKSGQGSFPEEWNVELLVDCGVIEANKGRRLVLFTSGILESVLNNDSELDRAFRFILFMMDKIAMHGKYDFVYCHSGVQALSPSIAHRMTIAYDMLPKEYSKNLGGLYVLHPCATFRLSLMSAWFWMSSKLWGKIQLYNSFDDLCKDLNIGKNIRRRFPHLVHHAHAELEGIPPPHTFGADLKWLCDEFGVSFDDSSHYRLYPLLPSGLVCVCEALERHDADSDFNIMFSGSAQSLYDCVGRLDEGFPLDPETPNEVLWCSLKLYLDCLPAPLLGADAFDEVVKRKIDENNLSAQRSLLLELLKKKLSPEVAYVTLYVASFLDKMIKISLRTSDTKNKRIAEQKERDNLADDGDEGPVMGSTKTDMLHPPILTQENLIHAFAPCFIRPRSTASFTGVVKHLPAVHALVKLLVGCVHESAFWIGNDDYKDTGHDDADHDTDTDTDSHEEGNF